MSKGEGMKDKYYYISGIEYDNDLMIYGSTFEKIIQAPSSSKAKQKLSDFFDMNLVKIYEIYETSSDAMI